MGMSIDDAIGVSETCQYYLSNQVGSKWCKSKYDAVTIAISTMRKYQQIEQIVNDRYGKPTLKFMDAIIKVVEDGKA